jgi:hypothetical protein
MARQDDGTAQDICEGKSAAREIRAAIARAAAFEYLFHLMPSYLAIKARQFGRKMRGQPGQTAKIPTGQFGKAYDHKKIGNNSYRLRERRQAGATDSLLTNPQPKD